MDETPDPSPAELLEAVTALARQYDRSVSATTSLAEEVNRRRNETRWLAIAVTVATLVLIIVALIVRDVDLSRERREREQLAEALYTQRDQHIAGCERANDVRAALRESYEITHSPSPPPALLPPDLRPLWTEIQDRTVEEGALLLSRPGVQIVDCLAAFPLSAVGR